MNSEFTEISIEDIEKVLEYLPYFEDPNNDYFQLSKESSLDPYIYNNKVTEFIRTPYAQHFIQSFDWVKWQDEAEKFVTDEQLLKNADIATMMKLFTTHIRKERFCSGHLACMIRSGHILQLLKRVNAINEEMKGIHVMAKSINKEPIIKRYFETNIFKDIKDDIRFLIELIINTGFEYDLQIRDGYFNLYYRGNSLAKITPKEITPETHRYEICIHKDFFLGTGAEGDKRFKLKKDKGVYKCLEIEGTQRNLLHPFFQKKYLFNDKGINRFVLSNAFEKVCKQAGIEGLRFHDLRHTFATRLAQAGIDPYTIQRLLGHKTASMTQRYSHHCVESLRRGIEVFERVRNVVSYKLLMLYKLLISDNNIVG